MSISGCMRLITNFTLALSISYVTLLFIVYIIKNLTLCLQCTVLHKLAILAFIVTLRQVSNCHFTNEKTEAQRGGQELARSHR